MHCILYRSVIVFVSRSGHCRMTLPERYLPAIIWMDGLIAEWLVRASESDSRSTGRDFDSRPGSLSRSNSGQVVIHILTYVPLSSKNSTEISAKCF